MSEMLKDIKELNEDSRLNPGKYKTGEFVDVEDGRFMFVFGKFIRIDRNWSYAPGFVDLPEIGFEPISDRAILYEIPMHDQVDDSGHLKPRSMSLTIQTATGMKTVKKDRSRYFIIKAGKAFSHAATGDDTVLEHGDEIILANYVDGLADKPVTEDPTGYVTAKFFGIHYTEIQGYIKHVKPPKVNSNEDVFPEKGSQSDDN